MFLLLIGLMACGNDPDLVDNSSLTEDTATEIEVSEDTGDAIDTAETDTGLEDTALEDTGFTDTAETATDDTSIEDTAIDEPDDTDPDTGEVTDTEEIDTAVEDTAADDQVDTGLTDTEDTVEQTGIIYVNPYHMPADGELVPNQFNDTSKYLFWADIEAFKIETISFDVPLYGFGAKYLEIDYPATDGSRKTKASTIYGYEARFSSLDILVPVGSGAEVYTRVMGDTYNCGFAMCAGDWVQVNLDASTKLFKAVGLTSGRHITESDLNVFIPGPTLTAKEPVECNSDSFWDLPILEDPGVTVRRSAMSPSGTGFIPGYQETFRYIVTRKTTSTGDYRIAKVAFNVLATDNGGSGWVKNLFSTGATVRNLSDGMTVFAGSANYSDCGKTVIVDGDAWLPEPGNTDTYGVFMDTTGASSTYDDCIQVSIDEAGIALVNDDTGEMFRVSLDVMLVAGRSICF